MNHVSLISTAIVVAVFLGVPGSPVHAQTPTSDSVAAVAVVRAYHQALKIGDSAAAMRLLAPDSVILESGGRETREDYRAHHLQDDILFSQSVSTRISAEQTVVSGDVAWVSSTNVTHGMFEKRPINSSGAELMVLSRTARGWTIRAIHWSSRRSAAGS